MCTILGKGSCVEADPKNGAAQSPATGGGDEIKGPSVAESGLQGYELTAWVGVFVRTKTPPEIIAKLNSLVTGFVNSVETKNYLATIGATPFPATPQELGAFQETDTRRWAEIVGTAKIEKK